MSAAIKRAKTDEAAVAASGMKSDDNTGEVIVDFGIDSGASTGMTPLMQAVYGGSTDTVRSLLDQGASVNAKRDDGFTALALAAFFGRTEIVQLLIERGADTLATTRCGTSAEIWATSRGFPKISKLLREARESTPGPARTALTVVPPQHSNRHDSETKDSAGKKAPLNLVPKTALRVGRVSRPPRKLPELIGPPAVSAPAFHPGHVFLTRVTSNGKNLTALVVALTITLGLAVFAIYQIGRAVTRNGKQIVPATSNVSGTPTSAARPDQRTEHREPASATPAALDSATTPADDKSENPSRDGIDVESAFKSSSADGTSSETTSTPAGTTNLAAGNPVSGSWANQRNFRNSTFSSSVSARKRKGGEADQPITQPLESETEPKPAPLSVEVKSKTAPPLSAEDKARGSGAQSAPMGITSAKPRTKVIQWP